ncbi:DUF1206 domain-containing protein [Streptomyces sp. NBC_00124]|uniref:DUF1206 domain-containing protein n=1 Tax=Streptomyces sp. NBC_00124 TaxID=2975662 RepID=UPI00225ABBB1|nr:DUF1206 domain-containing protein [Streptomyces sp. NBC_00124]MCX5363802.1 DUF1206 domain-containing protein [Streptomyces sp. NBC_00124]
MTSSNTQGRGRAVKSAARSTQNETLSAAGRAGFVARGVVYVLIGALALQIALSSGGESADRQGALAQIAAQPFGKAMLWALVVGFASMALWRGARAVLTRGPQRKAGSRLLDGGRAVFYAFVCWTTAVYAAAGGGQGSSGNEQSQDGTASALKLSYGQVLVGAAGCLLIGIGAVLAVRAAMQSFLKQLDTGAMSRRTKQIVTALGVSGGVARGVVFAAAGIFILVAAVQFDPDEAKGVDATLRSFTQTPAGPWLLVAVAIGLILFGVFSFASARWRRL